MFVTNTTDDYDNFTNTCINNENSFDINVLTLSLTIPGG